MALDNFVVDLTNYKERFGSRVPEGTYRVRVDDAELDQSKNGNQMINVWYVIQGGEHDGMTLTDRLVLAEKAMFRVVAFMQAIGLDTKRQKHTLSLKKIIGRVLDITVEDGEPYNGNVRSEVRAYARPAVAVATAQQDDDLDDFPAEPQEEATPATTAEDTAASAPAEEPAASPSSIPVAEESQEDTPASAEVDLDDIDEL